MIDHPRRPEHEEEDQKCQMKQSLEVFIQEEKGGAKEIGGVWYHFVNFVFLEWDDNMLVV